MIRKVKKKNKKAVFVKDLCAVLTTNQMALVLGLKRYRGLKWSAVCITPIARTLKIKLHLLQDALQGASAWYQLFRSREEVTAAK